MAPPSGLGTTPSVTEAPQSPRLLLSAEPHSVWRAKMAASASAITASFQMREEGGEEQG